MGFKRRWEMIALAIAFVKGPLAFNMNFQREYTMRYAWLQLVSVVRWFGGFGGFGGLNVQAADLYCISINFGL